MEKTLNFSLPFGKDKIPISIEEKRLLGVLVSDINDYVVKESGETIVSKAMDNPVGTKRLYELAKGKKKICLIASEYEKGLTAIFSIVNAPSDLDSILKKSKELYEQTADNILRLLNCSAKKKN